MSNTIEFSDKKTKSAKKRAMQVLYELTENLLDLNTTQTSKLPLPTHIIEELKIANKINAHVALRRQKRYLTQLLSQINVEPLTTFIQHQKYGHQKEIRQFQMVENWRDRLLNEQDALRAFALEFPNAQTDALRTLLSTHNHYTLKKRSSRTLFRLLYKIIYTQSD